MNQVPEKAISSSVTLCIKALSSQCNLTAQIEPVQDKQGYSLVNLINEMLELFIISLFTVVDLLCIVCFLGELMQDCQLPAKKSFGTSKFEFKSTI